MKASKLGGFLLLLGGATILITIYFEYRIGWIGTRRPQEEVPLFIYKNWRDLELIWGWQTFSHALFTMAYLLLLKSSEGIKSLIWAVLFLCGLLDFIAMGITLGSYYPALEVYREQPELFQTLAGAIKILYRTGQYGSVALLLVFCLEVFGKDGVLTRSLGWSILGIVIVPIAVGAIINFPIKVIGALWFLLPMVLGYSYWKNQE